VRSAHVGEVLEEQDLDDDTQAKRPTIAAMLAHHDVAVSGVITNASSAGTPLLEGPCSACHVHRELLVVDAGPGATRLQQHTRPVQAT
jgi:hypothetical protein